jgi:excinuclease ABC subunit B
MTGSMERAINETERRRKTQMKYNKKHGITPKTIQKKIKDIVGEEITKEKVKNILDLDVIGEKGKNVEEIIKEKERQMKEAAKNLQFELAAILRDEIRELKKPRNMPKHVPGTQ